VLAVVVGAALRAWLLAHLPLEGDEAVVGLMAHQIVHGHFSTFYWGQQYGGVEPYVVAAIFGIASPGPLALNVTAALFSAVSAVLAGMVVWEMCRRRGVAVAAGAVVWVWPYAALWNSVHELGFRQAALCLGLAFAWCALRLRRAPGSIGWSAGAGLALGLGWWASPEILYVALPAGAVTAFSAIRARRGPGGAWWSGARWGPALLAGAAAAVVGALPWLYTNVGSGFGSLRPSASGLSGQPGYWSRLGTFFVHVLPTQTGAQQLFTGDWVGGPVFGVLVLVAVLALAALAAWRLLRSASRRDAVPGGVTAVVAAAIFPFLFAFIPGTAYWQDGRYGIFLGPLLAVLVLGAAPRGAGTRLPARAVLTRTAVTVLCAAALAGATVLTAAGAYGSSAVPVTSPRSFASGWHDPDAAARAAVAGLERHGIHTAFGDYWTAYVLDLLAGGRVSVSPSPLDVVRDPVLARAVAAGRPAWLFFAPSALGAASYDFSNPEPGPGRYDETTFEGYLRSKGVPFRVVHLGVLDAVLPGHPVSPP
jgi:hypothetical protein